MSDSLYTTYTTAYYTDYTDISGIIKKITCTDGKYNNELKEEWEWANIEW